MKFKKVNIALVGLGNIGSYFFNTVKRNKINIASKTGKLPIIKYISARNKNKRRKIKFTKSQWINNPLDLVKKKDIDIIVELVGGAGGIAKKLVFSSLKNGKHVITANKSLISSYGDQLSVIAERNKVNLEYEASVAAGIPIIRSVKEGLIANKINKIYGILNGTTNFIISNMEKSGDKFNDVLKLAQKKGFAETNPLSDLNGKDVSEKIKILSSISYNKFLSKGKMLMEGIENIDQSDIVNAEKLGYKIRLLGISEIIQNQLSERVHPCLVSSNSYIGKINGVLNAVVVDGQPQGKTILQGEGAGPGPTTSALISDLCSVLRGNIKYPFGVSYKQRKKINKFNFLKHKFSVYLRLEVKDKFGVLSAVTSILAKNKISIKRVIQIPSKKNKSATIIIITHTSIEKNFNKSIKDLKKNSFLLKNPKIIRIEDV